MSRLNSTQLLQKIQPCQSACEIKLAQAYDIFKASSQHSAVAEMGDRLATDMGQKVGSYCVPFGGEGIKEGRNPKQPQGTSTDVEWPVIASLIIRG